MRHIMDKEWGKRVAARELEGREEREIAFHIHYIGSYLSQTRIALKYWPR